MHGAKGCANADGRAEEVEKNAAGSLRRPEAVVDEVDVVFYSLLGRFIEGYAESLCIEEKGEEAMGRVVKKMSPFFGQGNMRVV